MERNTEDVDLGTAGRLTYQLCYCTADADVAEVVEYFADKAFLLLDTETSGIDWKLHKLATMQLGYPTGSDPRVYVICVRSISRAAMQPIFQILESRKLGKLGQNIKFEGLYLGNELGVRLDGKGGLMDTQVAELIIRAGLFPETVGGAQGVNKKAYQATSMAALCRRYLGIEIDKDKALVTSFYTTPAGQHSRRQRVYAAGDVIYPFFIAKGQRKEIQARKLTGVVDVEFAFLPVILEAQLKGLLIDRKGWLDLYQEAVTQQYMTRRELDAIARDVTPQKELFPHIVEAQRPIFHKTKKAVNYDSPEQVKWLLVEYCRSLNWPIELVTGPRRLHDLKEVLGADWLDQQRAKHPKRTYEVDDVPDWILPEDRYMLLLKTDKATLKLGKLYKQLPARLVNLLTTYSEYSQRASAFGAKFLDHIWSKTGRVHPEFHQAATSTGRLSTEPNVQNQPRDARYRACFVPAPGYKFVIADLSQIEPRIIAHCSKDEVFLEAFRARDDIYCRLAERQLGVWPDLTTKHGKAQRQNTKTTSLALQYRMGPHKLRMRLNLSQETEIEAGERPPVTFFEARDQRTGFLDAAAGLALWQELQSSLANPQDTPRPKIWDQYLGAEVTWVEAPCGRKRFFPPDADNTYTEAANAPIQGGAATIAKLGAILARDIIIEKGFDATLVNAIHDENIWEVREDQAEEFAPLAKRAMEAAGEFYIAEIPILAEFPKGTNGVCDCWLKEVA